MKDMATRRTVRLRLSLNKADIKKVIFNNILIPKMVLEAALSFYQCGDNVYIRTTLR